MLLACPFALDRLEVSVATEGTADTLHLTADRGAILVATMIARPEGILGEKRVEIV